MTHTANKPPATAVLVLGMARSGTSAITRLLALLGVELGPAEALLPPIAGENAKGFFEHRPLMRINKELLQRLGGSWERPPHPLPGWELDPGFEDLRERARALLAADFAAARLWGFKDPRTSLTLPFWNQLLGDRVSYVICQRRPLDSARSLEHRNRIRLDDGIALWTHYTASALAYTAGHRRLIVAYEELFSARDALVARLADFLGVGRLGESAEVRAQVQEWIAADLRHHAGTLRELVEHPAVSVEAQALHLLLELAVAQRGSAAALASEQALDSMAQTLLRHEAARAALAPAFTARPPGADADGGPASLAAPSPPRPMRSTPDGSGIAMPAAGGIEASIVVIVADDPWAAMACLESIGDLQRDSPRHEVVLVDNASVGLRSIIAALQGDVQIVTLPERVGEEEALRAGVAAAQGKVVICLPTPGLLAANALSALCAEPAARQGPVIAAAPHVTPPSATLCRRGPGIEEIEVSVVVPTLDATSPAVRDCLRALQATIPVPHEIIVLDNGAPPQGFTAPVNAALRAARGRYLVVVNDDVRVLDGWWEPLADALDRGAPLVFPLTVAGRMRWEFAAWCFALRRDLLPSIAFGPGELFDPAMVVWCQDLDLRRRMAAAGMTPLCVPQSRIRHAGSRTVRVGAPHTALRSWIHAQAARDTAVFRAKYPHGHEPRADVAGREEGPSTGPPTLTPAHIEIDLAEQPLSFQADGPAWRSHTLPWPKAIEHFFLAGDLEVRAADSVQDILLRAVFCAQAGEELFWIDLVPGVLGRGRRSFSIPRESARAIPRAGARPEWARVRSVQLCARSRLRGALRRAPAGAAASDAEVGGARAADTGATTATISHLRLLALQHATAAAHA
jgi:GT2 family glycosyltransferase